MRGPAVLPAARRLLLGRGGGDVPSRLAALHRIREPPSGERQRFLGQRHRRAHRVQVLPQPDDHRHARLDRRRARPQAHRHAASRAVGGDACPREDGAARLHHPLPGGQLGLEQRHHAPRRFGLRPRAAPHRRGEHQVRHAHPAVLARLGRGAVHEAPREAARADSAGRRPVLHLRAQRPRGRRPRLPVPLQRALPRSRAAAGEARRVRAGAPVRPAHGAERALARRRLAAAPLPRAPPAAEVPGERAHHRARARARAPRGVQETARDGRRARQPGHGQAQGEGARVLPALPGEDPRALARHDGRAPARVRGDARARAHPRRRLREPRRRGGGGCARAVRGAQRRDASFRRRAVPPRAGGVPRGGERGALPRDFPRGHHQQLWRGRGARRRQLHAHGVRHRRRAGQGDVRALRAPARVSSGARRAPAVARRHVPAAEGGAHLNGPRGVSEAHRRVLRRVRGPEGEGVPGEVPRGPAEHHQLRHLVAAQREQGGRRVRARARARRRAERARRRRAPRAPRARRAPRVPGRARVRPPRRPGPP